MSSIAKIALFTVIVPGAVVALIPYMMVQIAGVRSALTYLGLVPITLGIGLYGWCVWSFWAFGKGTPAPIDPPKKLVVQGPYKIVRNPMYVAVFLILFGEVVLFDSFSLLKFVLVFFIIVELLIRFYEEPILKRKFGEAYTRYSRSVGRWIPRWGSDV